MSPHELDQLVHWMLLGLCRVQALLVPQGRRGTVGRVQRLEVPALYAQRVAEICQVTASVSVTVQPASSSRPNRVLLFEWAGDCAAGQKV